MIGAVDTNVLVYATVSGDLAKGARARDLLTRGMRSASIVLLLQTLGEFAHVATRKGGLSPDLVGATIHAWTAVFPVHPASGEELPAALTAMRDHRLPFWDAMLWATARRAGVSCLLTEDFQDGRTLGGVRFLNPFSAANDALVDRLLPP